MPRIQEPNQVTPPIPPQEQELPGKDSELRPRADHGEQSYKGSGRLKDKVALITGADSGIGRAIAIAFAREGADLAVSYLNEHSDAKETEHWVREAGRKISLLPGDIGDEDHCRRLVEHTQDTFGKIDILVNNAATQTVHQDIEEWSTEEWRATFRTNLDAMFFLCKATIPRMGEGGVIINTASVQAYQPSPDLLAYATTKGAILTFSKALAKLVAEKNIRVNIVAPGPVWTPLIPASFSADRSKHFGAKTAFKRPAQPAEMAPAYVFLAQPESSFVTGSVVDMTGGLLLP